MVWFDTLVVVILIVAFIRGYMSGLIIQAAYLVGLLLAGIFAGQVSTYIMPYFNFEPSSMHIAKPIMYILAFALIIVGVVLIGRVLTETLKAIKLNFLNRVAGSVFCAITYLFALSIILSIVNLFDNKQTFIPTTVQDKSITYSFVKKLAPTIIPYLKMVEDKMADS